MSYPITHLWILANPTDDDQTVVIRRTNDTNEEADLWKDNLLFRKIQRYLAYQVCDKPTPGLDVLTELALLGDKEQAPPGYTILDKTKDTAERSLKRKQLCTKYEPWSAQTTFISSIMVCSRSREHPAKHYVLLGHINSQLCILLKRGKFTQQEGASMTSVIPRVPMRPNPPQVPRSPIANPLAGVPFHVSSKYRASNDDDLLSHFSCRQKSSQEIEEEYEYTFALEKSLSATRLGAFASGVN